MGGECGPGCWAEAHRYEGILQHDALSLFIAILAGEGV
jgi:hypothetical protein